MTGEEQAGRVLVVEDETVNRLALVRGVEREGYAVRAVADGRAALDVLAAEPVDIVLLDLVMPVLDGFSVLSRMREDDSLRDIPVLVISAVDDVTSVARAIELGAVDVLPKPFEPTLLRVRLRTALVQGRLRRLEQAYLRQELALRQQERLTAMARLSAGLAHELNNPAAAALRTARQLAELVDAGDGPAVSAPEAAALDRLELQERIEGVLAARGVQRPWALSGDLAAAGVAPDGLDGMLATAGPDADSLARSTARRLAVRRAVRDLLTSVERVSAIVGALRSYSYLDRGEEQDVDVRRGLDDTVELLAHELDGVVVRRHYAPDLPTVTGNGRQLNQVWTALVDNAADALAGSGTLTLRAYPAGAEVVVEVEDDGPGVPAELTGTLFDPFVTSKEPGSGVGLGLTVARQIVTEGHGGRLAVRSRPGETVFTVALPVRR